MTPRPTIVPKLLLGVLVAACLPRFPEGERGVQCWTDRAADQATCLRNAQWCIEDAGNDFDDGEIDDCLAELARCDAASTQLAAQCERRTGCIAASAACEDACLASFEGSPGCFEDCTVELELCADWLDLDCERHCEEPYFECLTDATHLYHEVACDREHLDCILECYDRDPSEGAAQGECDPGRFTCDDDRVTACVDGTRVERFECTEVCADLGTQSTGCSEGDCACLGLPGGGSTCELGTSVFCACSAALGGVECSADDIAFLEQQCIDGVGGIPFECYAAFNGDVPEACDLLGEACSCPFTGDGECDEPEGTGICPEGSDPSDC